MIAHVAPKPPKAYRKLEFDLKGVDGISDAQIDGHLSLYAGYVKQVNALNQELAQMLARGQASGKSPEFAELTRRLGFEYNGMILHEYYFGNLCAGGEPKPPAGSRLTEALVGSFGSAEQWRTDFQAIGEMRYAATERDQYIEAFFWNLDWSVVETRFQEDRAVRPAA